MPFGKYKGQPGSVLLADVGYCDWLLTQAGILEKHPEVISFITQGEKTSSTPVHNALQAKLLDPRFTSYLGSVLGIESLRLREFEWFGFDAFLSGSPPVAVECKPSLSDDYPAVLRQIKTADQVLFSKMRASPHTQYRPKHGHWVNVLLVGSFNSSAISLEEAKAYFSLSGVKLVLVTEAEAAMELA